MKDLEEYKYVVDIPQCFNGDPVDEWYCVEYFKTKEEAIEFAKKYFLADDDGNINLISKIN